MFGGRLVLLVGILMAVNAVRFHALGEEQEDGRMEDYDVAEMVSKRIVRISDHHFLEVLKVKGNSIYQYSSGHFCIDAVLKYYANAHSLALNYDDQLINSIDFDQNNFTSPEKLVKTLQRVLKSETMSSYSHVFGIILQENMDGAIIETCIDQEMPFMILVNKKHSKSGHYVIAIGYDQEKYYFIDPIQQESIGFASKSDLSQLTQVRIRSQNRWSTTTGLIITYKHHKVGLASIHPSPTKQ